MTLPSLLATTLTVAALGMTALWGWSVRVRDASIVDRFWGLGFAVIAGVTFVLVDGYEGRGILLLSLTGVWGLRLSWHITRRNRGHGEDYRYAEMRERQGERFVVNSLFTVFLLQAAIMWFVSLPIQLGQYASEPSRLTPLDLLGAVIWGIGLAFEAIGDRQLARFKADPENEGKVFDEGLWRYTRHPNYFGDATVWWGLYLIAAATGPGRWTILSPILMTFLLMRVSGVAMLEASMSQRPGYAEYMRRTSAFFPWPPKAEERP